MLCPAGFHCPNVTLKVECPEPHTLTLTHPDLTLTRILTPTLTPTLTPIHPNPNPNPNQVECPEGFYCGEGSANATRCSADLGRSPEARCPPGSSEQPRRWSGLVIALLAVWLPTPYSKG